MNDIVLIKNPAKGRHQWRLGRVMELIYGSDNKVRSAKILKGDENWRTKVRKLELHSIGHLYPLELSITHNHVAESEIDPELLNLEVEEFVDSSESNLGPSPDANIIDMNITEPQEDLEGNNSFGFTRELDATDFQNLNLVPDTVEPTQSVEVETEPIEIPSISSRGRVRMPAKKIMHDQFISH